MTYTAASADKPVRRKVLVSGHWYVVEVWRDFVTMRPLRVRRPGAIVGVKWGSIYTRALLEQAPKRKRKASRKRLKVGV